MTDFDVQTIAVLPARDGLRTRSTAAFHIVRMAKLVLTMIVALGCGYATDAIACKDCPFPMKVADGRYLMPNGALYVELEEVLLPNRFSEVRVTLRDVRTGGVLATGAVRQRRGRRTIVVPLNDNNGQPVQAQIFWFDPTDRNHIQVKLTCTGCAIGRFFD
jgi:hypothetical protein